MHLDIHYVWIYSKKVKVFRKVKIFYNLKYREYMAGIVLFLFFKAMSVLRFSQHDFFSLYFSLYLFPFLFFLVCVVVARSAGLH